MRVFETLDYSVRDGVAELRLQRPERRNAVNHRMHVELPQAWSAIRCDPQVVVAIVTGAGSKAFCTGADLADLPRVEESDGHGAMAWTGLRNDVWKPVICAINGQVVGGGLHFVADADIVIASDEATFCDSHVSSGLVAGLEPVALARKIPLEAVLRLALIGRGYTMSAARACELGLVGEVVPASQLMERARELAALIAANSPSAMARTKRAIWRSLELPLSQSLDAAWDDIATHNRGPDFQEGIDAFLERRPPEWAAYDPEARDDR